MDDVDAVLVRAWLLAFRDDTDAGRAELESLLPELIAAGYVETDGQIWSFTGRGVARVDELVPDEPAG